MAVVVWRFYAINAMMHNNSSKQDTAAPGDHLSAMLRGLRLDGVDYRRCAMTTPWSVAYPAEPVARFHFVAQRGCWLLTPALDWVKLQPGDAVLLPRGAAHTLASEPGVTAAPLAACQVKKLCGNIFEVKAGGDGDVTLLFSGGMTFNVEPSHPLLRMLPELMRADELALSEPSIPQLLETMGCEVALDRVGAGGILARLADVVAASIIRSWVERGCGDASGWIAAARDPAIGKVLAAIHAAPEGDWTVETLARLMGASRSGFAGRFAMVVGETPARYVLQVRMHQARRWLGRDGLRIATVARRLGYDSEASFSRAFKRVTGFAPSRLPPEAGPPYSPFDASGPAGEAA
jgi:AraC-like DNA-binding protein